MEHAAELLDAAERVARDDYHARAHREAVWAGEAPPLETDAQLAA
jgi:hypothetical protein